MVNVDSLFYDRSHIKTQTQAPRINLASYQLQRQTSLKTRKSSLLALAMHSSIAKVGLALLAQLTAVYADTGFSLAADTYCITEFAPG